MITENIIFPKIAYQTPKSLLTTQRTILERSTKREEPFLYARPFDEIRTIDPTSSASSTNTPKPKTSSGTTSP